VVGNLNRKGSIILAASPALKKAHRISNVSRFFELPHDPEIILVQANMQDYIDVSVNITKLLLSYVPKEAIHVYSIDETWITLNGTEKLHGNRQQAARLIKEDILNTFGLTCSIGIGDNKFLAKVVMDLYAKKEGIAECTYEDVKVKLWPFPVEKIWGIGSRFQERLNALNMYTLGDVARGSKQLLKKEFGIMGEQIYWHAWGVDHSPVLGNFLNDEQKGFSNGITLLRDYDAQEIKTCMLELCEEACSRARAVHHVGRTVQLMIEYSNGSGGFNRSLSIEQPTNYTRNVYDVCLTLFHKFYDGYSSIRRISITLTNVSKRHYEQLDLFNQTSTSKDLHQTIDAIKAKYCPTSILYASNYLEEAIAIERSKKISGNYTKS